MRGFMGTRRARTPSVRSIATIASCSFLLAAMFAPVSRAAAPYPAAGSAVVDGATGEWALATDFFADMTDAGYTGRPVLAKLYLRYDCDDEVLYGLVLTQDGRKAQVTRPENAYLRIDGVGKLVSGLSGNNGTPPDFAWVGSDGTLADGFEASGPLAPGSYTIRAHVLIDDDSEDGYAPVDTIGRDIPLVIDCPTPTPTPTATPTATPTIAPTATPTASPTATPSVAPTASPTATPTVSPTATPTIAPTASPTATPSVAPTASPTATPSIAPTGSVGGSTGTPTITLPPTDIEGPTDGAGDGSGLRLAFLGLAALLGVLAVATPSGRRVRR